MRVVWIVPGFSSDEKDWCIPALLNLARGLAERCELHIIALRYPYRCGSYRIGSSTVHAIGGGHRGPVHTPEVWRRAAHVVRKLGAQVLHAFWAWEPGIIAAWFAPASSCVISLAGGELIHMPAIGYGLSGRVHVRFLLRWAFRRSRLITAGSSSLLRIAVPFVPRDRLRLAPLGIDLGMWPYQIPSHSGCRLLNVGSLEPVKGQRILIDAFRQVLVAFPGARLQIVGDGPLREGLREHAKSLAILDRLEFTGALRHDTLPAVYHASTVVVQSSLYESQGMAVLEAGASGLPIVGSNVGALADLAPDAALAIPTGEARPLAAAVIGLLRNRDRREDFSRRARARIEHEYGVDASIERFLNIYQEAESLKAED